MAAFSPDHARPAGALALLPSLSALEVRRDDWMALWRRCPDATPFQAPAWLLPWARLYAPDRTRAVILEDDGEIRAMVVVFSWRGSLLLAGTGPSDYGGGLFAADHRACAAAMLSRLGEIAGGLGCETIDLQQLRPASPLLSTPPPPGWTDTIEAGEDCPVARLEGPEGLAAASKRGRQNLRYAQRRVERRGGRVSLVAPGDLADAVEELETLHARRWRQRGEAGILADPLMRAFMPAAAAELAADGMLRLHRLQLEGRAAAVIAAIGGHRATYYYLGGFDPDLSSLSPGLVTLGSAMTHAKVEDGSDEFHFLRGREAYKYRWGARDRPTYRRRLVRG